MKDSLTVNVKKRAPKGKPIYSAEFVGKDGSMGFKNGEVYHIRISHRIGRRISIKRVSDNVVCDYDTMEAVLENWDRIKNLI